MTDRSQVTTALPTTRRDWVALLSTLGVRPNKGLGQSFLFDRDVIRRLVDAAEIEPSDHVVEVGPGLGILTEELLRRSRQVTAVELDPRLASHLQRLLGAVRTFHLIVGDVLKIDVDDVVTSDDDYLVVANLPYAVASAIIRHFLEHLHRPRRLVVMVQKEVAARLVAQPPDMTILGVATQFYADSRIAFDVAPGLFIPPPKVTSSVVMLDVRSEPPLPPQLRSRFFRLLNAGFRQKRKQLVNSVSAELNLPKDQVAAWLQSSSINPTRRAETLTVADWVEFTLHTPEMLAL